jgi:hypothetical protein
MQYLRFHSQQLEAHHTGRWLKGGIPPRGATKGAARGASGGSARGTLPGASSGAPVRNLLGDEAMQYLRFHSQQLEAHHTGRWLMEGSPPRGATRGAAKGTLPRAPLRNLLGDEAMQ